MVTERYYPQLDGVRAIAIGTVLIGHFIYFKPLQTLVSWGDSGVVLFFCLSGFLIQTTGILLRIKFNEVLPRWEGLKIFYARRALRIFPIYYVTIAVLFIIAYEPAREHFVRLISYTVNFVPGLPVPRDSLGATSHFWSLCVEEQFYLLWPLLVLFIKPRWLHGLILYVIILSIIYKTMAAFYGLSYFYIFRSVFGCMDSLGLGALLALYCQGQNKYALYRKKLILCGLFIGIPGAITFTLFRAFLHMDAFYKSWEWFGVIYFFLFSLASCVLIEFAMRNTSSGGRFLGCRPMVHVGRISYGIYVYHNFMPPLIDYYQQKGLLLLDRVEIMILELLLTLFLAQVSWTFCERPIQRLKAFFEYVPTRRGRGVTFIS